MNADARRLDELTEKIIGCAYKVANGLGAGFLEKVYEKSLSIELRKTGLHVEQQQPITVFYDGQVVGDFIADLLVAEMVLVELKATKTLDEIHMAQCLNYLKRGVTKAKNYVFGGTGSPKPPLGFLAWVNPSKKRFIIKYLVFGNNPLGKSFASLFLKASCRRQEITPLLKSPT